MTSEHHHLAIIIPTWNESRRLVLEPFHVFLAAHDDVLLCFVDDGSSDSTPELLSGLEERYPDQVVVLRLPVNGGKAEAVRSGLLWASEHGFQMGAYLDADLAAPLDTALQLRAALIRDANLVLAIGSRVKLLGWRIQRSELRHYLGRVFATFASLTLRLPVYDTQCGAKAVRLLPAVTKLLGDPFVSRWLFDVELIARIRDRIGPNAMKELPLPIWEDGGGSTVRLRDYFLAPIELWRIGRRYPARKDP